MKIPIVNITVIMYMKHFLLDPISFSATFCSLEASAPSDHQKDYADDHGTTITGRNHLEWGSTQEGN